MLSTRSHLRDLVVWIVVMDMVCLAAGIAIGIITRLSASELWSYLYLHIEGWIIFSATLILANYIAGSYRLQHSYSRFNLIVTWFFAVLFALLVLSLTSYAWLYENKQLGRGVLFLSVSYYSGLSLLIKMLVYRSLFRSHFFVCRTVVLGNTDMAEEVRTTVESDIVLPRHKVVAYMDVVPANAGSVGATTQMTGGVLRIRETADNIEKVIRSLDVNLIVLAMGRDWNYGDLYPKLRRLRFEGIEVLTALGVAEIYKGRTPIDMITQDFLMQAYMESSMPVVKRAKRFCDILISMAGLCILCIPALVVALFIKLSGPRSPVFYAQTRVGQFGREFRIYKFRTMQDNAEASTGPVWADKNDPRVTAFGRFLRASRLDEIPQFINVLKGDMSIVGPRPERPEIVTQLEREIPFFAERENVLPGLTGWAQIRYPYGSTVDDARCKLEYDLYYMKNLSLSFDLQIILSTLRIVIFGLEHKHGAF